jgi:hypothetical protein
MPLHKKVAVGTATFIARFESVALTGQLPIVMHGCSMH